MLRRSNRTASVASATKAPKPFGKKPATKKGSKATTKKTTPLPAVAETLPVSPHVHFSVSPEIPVDMSFNKVSTSSATAASLPNDVQGMINEYGSNKNPSVESQVTQSNDIPRPDNRVLVDTTTKSAARPSAIDLIKKNIEIQREKLATCMEFWSILTNNRPGNRSLTEEQIKQDQQYRISIRTFQSNIRDMKASLELLQEVDNVESSKTPASKGKNPTDADGKYQARYYTFRTGKKTDAEPVPFVEKFENAIKANGLSTRQIQPVFLDLMHHSLMTTMAEIFDKKATQLKRPLTWPEMKIEFLQSTVAHSLKDTYVLELQNFRRRAKETVFNMGSRFRSAVRLAEMKNTDEYVHSMFLTHLGGSVKASTAAYRDELKVKKEEITLDKLIDKAVQWEDATAILMPTYDAPHQVRQQSSAGKHYCKVCKTRGEHRTRDCPTKKNRGPNNNNNNNSTNNKRFNYQTYYQNGKRRRFNNSNNNDNNNNNTVGNSSSSNNNNTNAPLLTINDVTALLNTVQRQNTSDKGKYCTICKKTNHNTNEHRPRRNSVNNITPQQQALLNMLTNANNNGGNLN